MNAAQVLAIGIKAVAIVTIVKITHETIVRLAKS